MSIQHTHRAEQPTNRLLFPNFTVLRTKKKKLPGLSLDRNHQCPDNDTAIIFPVFHVWPLSDAAYVGL